jgi:transcriptional regulator with XRE-family HTH domain
MVTGAQLRDARRNRGLTQVELAAKVGQSQAYVSLLEKGKRSASASVARRLARVLRMPPTALPLRMNRLRARHHSGARVADSLASLGYPGYAYLKRPLRLVNPVEVLLCGLMKDRFEPRLFEALPWLLLNFGGYDLEELSRAARDHNVQNRLGFVAALAGAAAGSTPEYSHRVSELKRLVSELEPYRLAREDDLGQTFKSERLRTWIRKNRTRAAAHWNLLTDLAPEQLPYVK